MAISKVSKKVNTLVSRNIAYVKFRVCNKATKVWGNLPVDLNWFRQIFVAVLENMNCKDYITKFPILFAANHQLVAITTSKVLPKITITRVTTRITVIKDMVIKAMVINNPITVIMMIIINNLMGVNQTKGKGIYIRVAFIYSHLFNFNLVNILLPSSGLQA